MPEPPRPTGALAIQAAHATIDHSKSAMPWSLRDVDCFRGLSEAEIEELTSHFEQRAFRAGAPIVDSDTPAEQVYLVKQGTVRLFLREEGGREIPFDVVERGGLFGVSTLFGPGIDGLRAKAETDATICIGGPDTLQVLSRWPRVMQNVVLQLGGRILRVEEELEGVASLDARTRLARLLYRLAQEAGEPAPGGGRVIRGHLTHEDLAHQIGASRETVTRLLARLAAEGHLQREGRRLVIRDPAAFRRDFGLHD